MLSYVRDRLLNLRLTRDEKEIKIGFTATALIITALLANVAYLNFFIINDFSSRPVSTSNTAASLPSPSAITTASAVPSSTPQSVQQVTIQPTPSSTKDYYISLGSGTNQSTDWADVTGTLNTFDISQYSNIKEVHLESNINVPTANGSVSIRLFDKTDGYAVWNSDRTVQSQGTGDLLISQNIIYPQGAKLYSVQMKSQFGAPATLVQARLHITAQ